jgi:hypothetical protein
MSEAVTPLPQYAFMAWCLVKAQGQLFTFYNLLNSNHMKELNGRIILKLILEEQAVMMTPELRKLVMI